MYHPYFRGKQYELITIREMASTLSAASFCPLIEPVRETLSGLQKSLSAIVEAGGSSVLIVNPYHGDLSGDAAALTTLLQTDFLEHPSISAGILLTPETSTDEAIVCYQEHVNHSPTFVHAGFTDARGLVDRLPTPESTDCHIFSEHHCGKLYQRHFKNSRRILLRDGFEKKRNRDYKLVEFFSDLHITFGDEGMDGFGDFLVVGDGYSDTGGPAYAVAIHLTFIDPTQDDAMQVYHFVSERQDTPKDPAGKFAEALAKMITVLDSPDSHVLETEAVREFRLLHSRGHFPGLGYAKKLSMNHHIATLADYLETT